MVDDTFVVTTETLSPDNFALLLKVELEVMVLVVVAAAVVVISLKYPCFKMACYLLNIMELTTE